MLIYYISHMSPLHNRANDIQRTGLASSCTRT